jgi:hypothetical protein
MDLWMFLDPLLGKALRPIQGCPILGCQISAISRGFSQVLSFGLLAVEVGRS